MNTLLAATTTLLLAQLLAPGPATALTGPWRFHLGDDASWSAPAFDDHDWERVDLTAPPGAHDGDVGHPHYVPGWGARGHPGAQGFGWYRLRMRGPLFVSLPPLVDDGYELFWNGARVARTADLTRSPPAVFSAEPKLLELGPGESVLAVRVWMGPGSWEEPPDAEAGGLHVAPVAGTRAQVEAEVSAERRTLFWGYGVDALEPVLMLLLAWRWRARPWWAVALVCTALLRGNQAFFYWWHVESTDVFDLLRNLVLFPLGLFAWTCAWQASRVDRKAREARKARQARDARQARWIRWAALGAAVAESGFALASRHHQRPGLFAASVAARCLFLALGGVAWRRLTWAERGTMLLVFMGYFARELSLLHVPGIWFPLGVGVSRTQLGYALLILLLALIPYGRQRRAQPAPGG